MEVLYSRFGQMSYADEVVACVLTPKAGDRTLRFLVVNLAEKAAQT